MNNINKKKFPHGIVQGLTGAFDSSFKNRVNNPNTYTIFITDYNTFINGLLPRDECSINNFCIVDIAIDQSNGLGIS